MMRFYAQQFAQMVSEIERAESVLMLSMAGTAHTAQWSEASANATRGAIMLVGKHLASLPVSPVILEQATRLHSEVTKAAFSDMSQRQVIYRLVQELKHNVLGDLRQHYYLLIPAIDRPLVEKPLEYWTDTVVQAFPEAQTDMESAAKCYALELWNASVFHCMCVAQHGLRRLADRLGVSFSKDFDALNWGQIIKEMDKHLRDLDQKTKTDQIRADLKLGGEVSAHCFGMKEAWRNYVMHGKDNYNPEQTRRIGDSVRAIMVALAQ